MRDTGKATWATSMRTLKKWFTSSQALLSILLVQVFATGMELLSRVILVQGTFVFALVAYRHIIAAICVAPSAIYFERGQTKKFTWKVWFWLFINALTGMTMAQGLFYYGLRDTSATYSSSFLNLIPICTFLTSIICRMETLGLQTWAAWFIAQVMLLEVFPLRAKGPTYPPMFNPLVLIFVALSEAILLGEPLGVGTLLGMVLIIVGLYSFLWGKKSATQCLPQTNVAAAEESMGSYYLIEREDMEYP
ncbi:WAT1-related protein [Spatholobus suberectus]|nr:WAT1-related protein [Spatholobus suberectus]